MSCLADEVEKLAARLRIPTVRSSLNSYQAARDLLAEAVEMLGLSGTVPVPRIKDWLRRVAEATGVAEEQSDGR